MDRAGAWRVEPAMAVRVARPGSGGVGPRAGRRNRSEFKRKSQACATADADHGLEAIYPKPRTTVRCPEHKIYPYLLRNVEIERPNQVWSTDITYIPMRGGYVYLTAVMDWYSRYVLSWRLSNTLDGAFCIAALEEALVTSEPEIFNTDQGVQFTSLAFTSCLESRGVAMSLDGRGRGVDNVFVERLWRTVKYEEVYLKDYEEPWPAEAR